MRGYAERVADDPEPELFEAQPSGWSVRPDLFVIHDVMSLAQRRLDVRR
jgi:hypothetical protein